MVGVCSKTLTNLDGGATTAGLVGWEGFVLGATDGVVAGVVANADFKPVAGCCLIIDLMPLSVEAGPAITKKE